MNFSLAVKTVVLKFIYSETITEIWQNLPVDYFKSNGKFGHIFVTFSECMNFIDIWFVKQDIQNIVKNKNMQFFMENLKIKRKRTIFFWPSGAGIRTPDFQQFSCPWFEFSCEVRSPRSNQNKLLKDIGLYLKPHPPDWWPRF